MTDTLPLSEQARQLMFEVGRLESARQLTDADTEGLDARIAELEAELFDEPSFRWNFRTPGQIRLEHSYPVDWLADEYAGVEVLVRGRRCRIENLRWRDRDRPDAEPGWEHGYWSVTVDDLDDGHRGVAYFPKWTVLDLAPMLPDPDFAEDHR